MQVGSGQLPLLRPQLQTARFSTTPSSCPFQFQIGPVSLLFASPQVLHRPTVRLLLTGTPAFTSGILISQDSSSCTTWWSGAKIQEQASVAATHTSGLLCSVMSLCASVGSVLCPPVSLLPKKPSPGKAAACLRGPTYFLTTAHYHRHCLF